jgi:hypothetical protein
MMRARTLIPFIIASAALGCASLRPANHAAWNDDFEALLAHMPVAYANYEYSVRVRRLDVAALAARTRKQLEAARTERGTRAAIGGFLAAFDDYHVALEDAPASRESSSSDPTTYSSCRALGFRDRDRDFHPAIRRQAGFRADDAGALPTARLTLDERTVYAVRIPLFSESQFPGICETLWPRFAKGSDCSSSCADSLWSAVGDSALADLAARLRDGARDSSGVLLVDLTGNGGGSEWAETIARRLTSHALSRPAVGMVRHQHWRRALGEHPNTRDSMLLAELARPCDWSGVARGQPAPECSPLVVAPAESLAPSASPMWTGPILIVADRRTASASEEFVAMLVDAGVAKVVGERTMGIGCGFTNGGIDFRLPRSGLSVRLPDCARFRKDGANERAGIEPDAGAWGKGDASSQAEVVRAALGRLRR